MKLLDVLQSTTAYFEKRGIESARLNAEHLLAHSLGQKRIELYLEFERELSETELAPVRELVRRRGQGEPLQHLLGTVEFCGRTFLIDKRALIPRPETEQLVEFVEIEKPAARILDVGTGSGVIAISLAARFPAAQVNAVDVSEDALDLARENAARIEAGARVQFAISDLLEAVDGRFDLIVANLPYVATTERTNLSREVLHDPEIALFAGDDGESLIRRLIADAPAHLEPGGTLALEIGVGQEGSLSALLQEKNYHGIVTKKDYQGVTRFVFAKHR
jgi:release factor glutamine methyltransferase